MNERMKETKLSRIKTRIQEKIKITPENKCSFCTATICCTYITQHIDAPRSKEDFRQLLWQVSHAHVKIYKDDDGWTLLVDGSSFIFQPL